MNNAGFRDYFKRGTGLGLGFSLGALLLAGGFLLAQSVSLNRFSSGDLVSSSQINANFSALNLAVAKNVPLGTIVAWHRDLGGGPTIPDGWVECDGSLVNDSASPFDGLTLPDLNGEGRFLRGSAASGTMQDSMIRSHRHINTAHTHGMGMIYGDGTPGSGHQSYIFKSGSRDDGAIVNKSGALSTGGAASTMGDAVELSGAGMATGSETRPINMSVIWIMRIK